MNGSKRAGGRRFKSGQAHICSAGVVRPIIRPFRLQKTGFSWGNLRKTGRDLGSNPRRSIILKIKPSGRSHKNEKKFQALEEEKTDEMEVAAQKDEEGKKEKNEVIILFYLMLIVSVPILKLI